MQGIAVAQVNIPPNTLRAYRNAVNTPIVICWHLNVLVVEPQYNQRLRTAKWKELKKLNPGESATYLIVGEEVSGDAGNFHFFRYLIKEGEPRLDPPGYKVLGKIKIERSRYSINLAELPPLSPNDFEKYKKELKLDKLTYGDHLFVTKAINALKGNETIIDLLDSKARSVADGTVILTAKKEEATFHVFDVDTKQTDKTPYPKGEFVKSLGNTIWLHTKMPNGMEYTVIYAQLDDVDVSIGSFVKQSKTIGKWNKKRDITMWRVRGKQERFLQNEPYRVFPINP
jgi:hypothetical protein